MKSQCNTIVTVVAAILMAGCGATHHTADVRTADDIDRISVGTVQKEIVIGMSAADVASVLGSPNIVATEEARQETWIYDKISSDVTYSRSSGTVVGLIFGGAGGGAGVGAANAGSSSSSQRTLTVIIKFDGNSKVRDFSYHTSRF